MTSAITAKKVASKKKAQPELTEDEQREVLEREKQIKERQAETQLELAKLFLEKKKSDIALRRLKEIVAEYSGTAAATEAKILTKKL